MRKIHALGLDRIPLADERLLAKLGERLIEGGASTLETLAETSMHYALDWRNWLGSAPDQVAGWLEQPPEKRFSEAALIVYSNLLGQRLSPSRVYLTLTELRTAAKHICPDLAPTCFDGVILCAKTQAAASEPEEKRRLLSLSDADLPGEDARRLREFLDHGLVQVSARLKASDDARTPKSVGGNARKHVRSEYLTFLGFVSRVQPQALTGDATRFSSDQLHLYHRDYVARLGEASGARMLYQLRYAVSKLWPEQCLSWFDNAKHAICGAPRQKLSFDRDLMPAGPPDELGKPGEPGEKARLERVINPLRPVDQALIMNARRRGPKGLGKSGGHRDSLWFAVELFYGAAARADESWLARPLETKVTKAAIEAFKTMLGEMRYSPVSIAQELDRVRIVFERLYAVEFTRGGGLSRSDLDWLLEQAHGLRLQADPRRPSKPAVSMQEAVATAEAELIRVQAVFEINCAAKYPWRNLKMLGLQYRNALTQLSQALLALRCSNVASLALDETIFQTPDSWGVLFDYTLVKTRVTLVRLYPQRCHAALVYFFETVTRFISPDDLKAGHPSAKGGRLSISGLQKSVPATSLKLTGKRMRVKDFRAALATAAVPRKGDLPGLAQNSLDHTEPTKTELWYEGEDDPSGLSQLARDFDWAFRPDGSPAARCGLAAGLRRLSVRPGLARGHSLRVSAAGSPLPGSRASAGRTWLHRPARSVQGAREGRGNGTWQGIKHGDAS